MLVVKKSHLSARVMARTVLLNCPIKAEIRAVDSLSDLSRFENFVIVMIIIIISRETLSWIIF